MLILCWVAQGWPRRSEGGEEVGWGDIKNQSVCEGAEVYKAGQCGGNMLENVCVKYNNDSVHEFVLPQDSRVKQRMDTKEFGQCLPA